MTTPQPYRIKFIADDAFIEQLKVDAAQQPEAIKVESERKDEDATRLGFDLISISTVVTVISGLFSIAEVAAKIYKWWQKSRANKVIVQTPFQTVELHKSAGITEEDIRKAIDVKQKS